MPGTISAEQTISTACAVFKIDLKGRFVYIDDETEELLGSPREELFGKSIYEFISTDSHLVLDKILGHHKRYESFYESLPLKIKDREGRFRDQDAVITLNFIGGNPVNYQLILIPGRTENTTPGTNWERRLLDLMRLDPEKVDFRELTEIFCNVGGYGSGECYRGVGEEKLAVVASYPHHDPGHTAPVYIEHFRHETGSRFSHVPEDCRLHENFGSNKSEAVLTLELAPGKCLVIWLYGPAEFRPPAINIETIRLYIDTWNERFRTKNVGVSPGARFSLLGAAADAINLGLVVVDGEYEVLYGNENFARLFGARNDEKPATNFKDLYAAADIRDFRGSPLPFESSAMAGAVVNGDFASDFLRIDGCRQPVLIMAGPATLSDYDCFIYVLVPYQEGAAEAYTLNDSGSRMLQSMAHDIRAPLITIEAFARRLQDRYKDQLDQNGRFAVDTIVQNGAILQNMINDLGDLSQNRLETEEPEKIFVKQIIEDQFEKLRYCYPGTDYQVRVPARLPEISAPRKKLVQVFHKIIDNALKYSAASKSPRIQVEYDLIDRWHRFAVIDNGPGIDRDYSEKIFRAFFRTPEAAGMPGTGMGLAIAHDIVTAWGGQMWLDTDYNQGAKIVFTLPPDTQG